ncbi:hypothetical protein ACIBJI_40145 [Nocardia sp. NPDC050408]|uniref:hypothetical protein n=1 Tax=Nocardia sp. NPDC050408 TaxID=3364319 RepID=UPI003791F7EB
MNLPFWRRHRGDGEVAELRDQVVARVKRVASVEDLVVVIDDAIDALEYLLAPPVVATEVELLALTGPIRGQEWSPMVWSCRNDGEDITVEQARQIMREHIECSGTGRGPDDPAVCRRKRKALTVLTKAGVLKPDSRHIAALA